jgi:glycosyltransferase involved in cell wall biosynthesis
MNHKTFHIGFLTSEYVIPPGKLDGGLATYIQKVGRGLVQRGHQVSVFCLSDRNYEWVDEGVRVYEVRSDLNKIARGLSSISLPTAEFERIISNSSELAKKLWEVHEKIPLDLIQAASYYAVGIALCNNGKIPLVTRVSSLAPLYRNANKAGRNANSLSTALSDWCEIHQLDNSDSTFAPSLLMAENCLKLTQATPQVIRSPIDVYNQDQDESFYEQNLHGMKYLLYFGTLNRMKGMEIISKSVSGILEEFPDLHFVFIGRSQFAEDGSSYAAKIFQENEKWSNNLHYYRSLPKQKLYPVIRNSFGVLVPSLVDNYPNTCIEAMQYGKIVIGTYGSSLDEMIVDGETGILIQKDNVESLQVGIRKLLALPFEHKRKMERNILQTFDQINSEDRVGQLINLYRDTILSYKPSNEESLNWENLFLRGKLRKALRIGFFPGVFLKIVQKWNNSRKHPTGRK